MLARLLSPLADEAMSMRLSSELFLLAALVALYEPTSSRLSSEVVRSRRLSSHMESWGAGKAAHAVGDDVFCCCCGCSCCVGRCHVVGG